jgi:PAS domain S-box-containing protein
LNGITRILNVGGAESLRHARSHDLRGSGYEVIDLATGDRAVDLARQLKPEVILLSAGPGENANSTLSRLKADTVTRKIPLLALTDALTTERDEALLYDSGAESCLRAPAPRVLVAAVRAAIRTAQMQTDLRHTLKVERISRHELAAAKRAIVESETLYREMSESFPYGVWMSDPSGTPIFVSDSFLALTETTIEQARAGDWRKRIASEDMDGYLETWRRSIQTGEPWEHEYRVLGPDGEYHHVLSRGRPILNQQSEVVAWAGINLDLNERKRQENQIQRLASSEEMRRRQLEAIINSVRQALVMFDLESQTIVMNPAGQQLYGFTAQEMPVAPDMLKAMLELRNSDGKEVPFEQSPLMLAARGSTVSDMELHVHRRDTNRFWIGSCGAAPVWDVSGCVRFAVNVIQDITEQKVAEKALRESEARFRILTQSIPNLVWTADAEGRTIYLSTQWLDYTGQTLEEACGWGWLNAVHPDDADRATRSWLEAVASMRSYESLYRLRRRDGEFRWHIVRGWASQNEAGETLQWIGTCTDIQEQKDDEDELRRANILLKRSNEDLQHFAFAISHDLQEPLRMVSKFTEILARRLEDKLTPDLADYVDYIKDNAGRMRQMISDLLTYSRITHEDDAPGRQSSESQAALMWALNNLQASIEDSGALVIGADLPAVEADFGRLTQLFQNLLSNCIKYRGEQQARIEVTAEREGEMWRFCVADNGIGIDPAHHDRIFGVFKRLHGREVPGTGIGLALCRRIVERYGGRIWVDSAKGKGARFYFTFPKAERHAALAARS